MAFRIITPGDLEGVGVAPPFSIEPSAEGMDPTDLQDKFEETVRTLAIPAYNELSEKLNDGRGAEEIVAIDPVTLLQVSMQGAMNALKQYTDRKVVEIGAGDMAMVEYDPHGVNKADGGLPATAFATYIHEKNGTVHSLLRENGGPVIRFTADADYAENDTFTINGEAVANGMAFPDNAFVTGQEVACVVNGAGIWIVGVSPRLVQLGIRRKQLWAGDVVLNGTIPIENVAQYDSLIITGSSGAKYRVEKTLAGTDFTGGGLTTSIQTAIESNTTMLAIAANGNSLTVKYLSNIGHNASGNHSQNYVGRIRAVEIEYIG